MKQVWEVDIFELYVGKTWQVGRANKHRSKGIGQMNEEHPEKAFVLPMNVGISGTF